LSGIFSGAGVVINHGINLLGSFAFAQGSSGEGAVL
jgi:hypothetical protein